MEVEQRADLVEALALGGRNEDVVGVREDIRQPAGGPVVRGSAKTETVDATLGACKCSTSVPFLQN